MRRMLIATILLALAAPLAAFAVVGLAGMVLTSVVELVLVAPFALGRGAT